MTPTTPAGSGPDAFQVLTLAIAVAGLLLGLFNAFVQWQTYRRDRADLKVEASFVFPTYRTPNGMKLGDDMVQIVATNTGRLPLTVTGMALGVSGGGSIPFEETAPGSTVPAVLGPGEHTAMWARSDALAEALKENQRTIVSIIAHGPGSQKWVNKKVKGVGSLGRT